MVLYILQDSIILITMFIFLKKLNNHLYTADLILWVMMFIRSWIDYKCQFLIMNVGLYTNLNNDSYTLLRRYSSSPAVISWNDLT